MRQHRHAKGTDAHVTADRSDNAGRRPRGTKPIAEGGPRPHLGTCKACGASVIHHKRANAVPIMLDPEELQHGDPGARWVMCFCIPDALPAAVPDLPFYREHVCPKAPQEKV